MSSKDAVGALMGIFVLIAPAATQASPPANDAIVLALAVDSIALAGASKGWVSSTPGGPDALDRMGSYNPHLDIAGKDQREKSCTLCHTPGQGRSTQVAGAAVPSLRPFATNGVGPGSQTMVCLSCHDGVSTSHRSAGHGLPTTESASWMTQVAMANAPALGGVRSGQHPVGVRYPKGFAKQMHPLGLVKADGLPFFGERGDQLECSTCHDPHSNRFPPYLRMANTRSALCLTCHDK